MIRVKVKDLSNLQVITEKAMERAGQYLLRLQQQRLEQGIGSDGSPMRAYSEDYAEFRREKGRATDRRTLTFTGLMRNRRKVIKVTRTSVTIGWPAGDEAAKARGNDARTPFIRATEEERTKVAAMLKAEIVEALRQQIATAPKR